MVEFEGHQDMSLTIVPNSPSRLDVPPSHPKVKLAEQIPYVALPRKPWIQHDSAKKRLKEAFHMHVEPLIPVFSDLPIDEALTTGPSCAFQRLLRIAVVAASLPFLPFTDVIGLGFTSRERAIETSYQYVKVSMVQSHFARPC